MARYAKFFVAVSAFIGVISAAGADGSFSNEEIGAIIISGLGAFGVYRVKNKEI